MFICLAILGCKGVYDGPPPSGDGAAIYGRVLGILGSGINEVQICAKEVDVPCVTTEKDGDFLLDHLPEDEDIVVVMKRDGYLTTAYHHNTSLAQEWRKTLMSDSIINTMTSRAETEQKPGKGHAMFIVWSGPDYDEFDRVEGISVTIRPSQGEKFYQAGGGFPDPELKATSNSGGGGVFNLEPGDYELTFSGAGKTCEPWFSHDFEPGEPVPMTVYPEMGSYIDLVCK